MTRSQSVFLTAVVAMVLGIVIGVVGLLALVPQLSMSADEAAAQLDGAAEPGAYGTR
jgi:hypothetical protein